MGSSKTHQYKARIIDMALLGRAISHPARVEIFEVLKLHGITRSNSLCQHLQLSPSTVHEHLLKMREAGVIHLTYEFHGYLITPIPERMDQLAKFLERS